MPKIIDEAKELIMVAAKKRLFAEGINKLTIRAVADDCNIAIGTIYNYFTSKEMLVGEIMLDDWCHITEKADEECRNCTSVMEGIEIVCNALTEFSDSYQKVFNEQRVTALTKRTIDGRHEMLIGRLSKMLRIIFDKFSVEYDRSLLIFVSETILVEANYRYNFDEYKRLIGSVINYKEGEHNEQL